MKYLFLLLISTTATAGSLDDYVSRVLLKDCTNVMKSVKATNPLFSGGKITYTDTVTLFCHNKYAFRYRWTPDAYTYRVLFWNGPTAAPIVVNTKNSVVVQLLDHGDWTIQVEHIDALGNSYFEKPIYVEYHW